MRPHATHRAATVALEAALRADSLTNRYHATDGMPELPTAGIVERYVDMVLGREVRPTVIVLFSAVGIVLIIACTNVASLLVARGIARTPELGIRAALGANRGQLASQLLLESLLLGLVGGLLGVGLAVALVRIGVALAPAELPVVATAHMDPRVLAFAAGVTLAATLGAGLVPALQGGRLHGEWALRGTGRAITTGPVARLSRHILVGAQVALALVVLSAAGLLGSTVVRMQQTPLGFDIKHLLFFFPDQTPWVVPRSPDSLPAYTSRWRAALDRALRDVPQVPGLSTATTTDGLPLQGNRPMATYVTDDQSSTRVAIDRHARVVDALDDYFGVLRVPLLAGRSLTRKDDSTAPRAAVVSKSLADEAWPHASPIGRRLLFPDDTVHRWWTVVGEAADSRYGDLSGAPRPTIYLSARQDIPGSSWYAVRTAGDPARSVAGLDAAFHEADPDFGPSRIETGPDLLKGRLARPRALAVLFAALSGTALLLAAVGLFGVLSAYVRVRRRELAVRSALGATAGQLRSLVLAQTLGVAAGGIAFGVPIAIGSSNVLRALVTDVRPTNPLVMGIVAVVVLIAVAAATYGPMVRATRVDARTALAAE
jgi:predicted permease